jgi:hypothetical protein
MPPYRTIPSNEEPNQNWDNIMYVAKGENA